jgi:uncharacterized repeat protein (TIGR02543 family)
MAIIEEKIKELLAEAKTLLKNKQVSETVEKMKLVLQLDSENEEAKYVLEKLNSATGIQIDPQRKLLIITEETELFSNIKVLFNGIEIGQLNNGFFEFALRNDGIVELKHEYLNINISAHKNQSSVVILKIDKEKNQLFFDQFDFENLEPLLELSKKFIMQHKYNIASVILEQILIFDSANSNAYFQRLLIELEIKTPNQLNDSQVLLDDNENYNKALRYSYNLFRRELLSYANIARENLYNNALSDVENRRYEDALSKFKTIKKYKDSETRIENLEKTINDIEIERRYIKAITYFEKGQLSNSFDLFETMNSYKDASKYIEKITNLRNTEAKYQSGIINQSYARIEQIESSIQILQELGDYKDSVSLVTEYKILLQITIEKQNEINRRRIKSKKTIKLANWIGAPVILLLIAFLVINSTIFVPTNKYNDAMTLINSGNYAEAKAILSDIKGFSDSENQITIIDAYIAFEIQDYEEGIALLEGIGIPVDVSYDLDGGMSTTINFSLFVPLSLGDDTPYKDGYTFNGWELIDYSINNAKGDYNAEVELKATYLLSQYTIIFELNGGTGVSDLSYNINSSTILLPNPTRDGYTFGGWYKNSSFSVYSTDMVYSGSTEDYIFYAKWNAETYTVIFDANDGSLEESGRSVVFDSYVNLPTPTFDDINYKFVGWYDGNTKVVTGQWKIANDVTLTAQWESIFTYIQTGSTVSITGFRFPFTGNNLIFPSDIFGNAVTIISTTFVPSQITSIVVPNSVQTITRGAFKGASNLVSITMPFVGSSRTAISGTATFGYIFGTESYSNTYSAEPWDKGRPYGESYYIPNTLTTVIITDTETIPAYAFQDIKIRTVIFPDNLVSIGYWSFYYVRLKGSLIIPISVTSISRSAFDANSTISEFTIYVHATSKPTGWDKDWIDIEERVVWGYTGN